MSSARARVHAFLHPKSVPVHPDPSLNHHLVPLAWLALGFKDAGFTTTWGPEAPNGYDLALVSDVGSWGQPDPDRPVLYLLDDAGLTPRGDGLPKHWRILSDNDWTHEHMTDSGYASQVCWPAVDPHIFHDLGLARNVPLGFRGRYYPDDPYYQGRNKCIEWLRANLTGFELHPSGDCENHDQGGKQWTYRELNMFRNRCRAYFIHTYDGERGFSPHAMEAVASGALVFHNRTPGAEKILRDHVTFYDSASDIPQLLRDTHLPLARPNWGASHQLAAEGHTWLIRALQAAAFAKLEGLI